MDKIDISKHVFTVYLQDNEKMPYMLFSYYANIGLIYLN